MTYKEALAWAIAELKGTASPVLDASLLFEHATGSNKVQQILKEDDVLADSDLGIFKTLVSRRKNDEPLAYITGEREFWGLPFCVEEGVLIPRPDTETLVEEALTHAAADQSLKILELGVGSGAIILSLLSELKNAKAIAVDKSPIPIKVASKNAKRLKLLDRISFVQGSWADSVDETFDMIVSNPPYIRPEVIAELETGVKDHEPMMALDGGADGLDCYRELLDSVRTKITVGGVILLEIGYDQGQSVPELMKDDYENVKVCKDLAGQDRVIVGIRKG